MRSLVNCHLESEMLEFIECLIARIRELEHELAHEGDEIANWRVDVGSALFPESADDDNWEPQPLEECVAEIKKLKKRESEKL